MTGADQILCPHKIPISQVCPKCLSSAGRHVPLNGAGLLPNAPVPPVAGTKEQPAALLGKVIGYCPVCGNACTATNAIARNPNGRGMVQACRVDPHKRSIVHGSPICEGSNAQVQVKFEPMPEDFAVPDAEEAKPRDCEKCQDSKHIAIPQRPPLTRGFRVLACPECQNPPRDDEGNVTHCIHGRAIADEECEPCLDVVKKKVGEDVAEKMVESIEDETPETKSASAKTDHRTH